LDYLSSEYCACSLEVCVICCWHTFAAVTHMNETSVSLVQDRKIAKCLLDEELPQMLLAKATLTEQSEADLDLVAVNEDLLNRTFRCPIIQDVVCKV
jgi:hypothetical protein